MHYLNIRKLGNKQQTWCYSIFERVFALPHRSNSSPDIVQYYEWSVMSKEGKRFIIRRKNTSAIDHCKQMRRWRHQTSSLLQKIIFFVTITSFRTVLQAQSLTFSTWVGVTLEHFHQNNQAQLRVSDVLFKR